MVKTLTRQGNSSALIIERPLMQLLGIDEETPLKITVEGRRLIVEPADTKDRSKLKEIVARTGRKNSELFKRLAK